MRDSEQLTRSSQRKSKGFLASTICTTMSLHHQYHANCSHITQLKTDLLSTTLQSCFQNSRFLSNGVNVSLSSSCKWARFLLHSRKDSLSLCSSSSGVVDVSHSGLGKTSTINHEVKIKGKTFECLYLHTCEECQGTASFDPVLS